MRVSHTFASTIEQASNGESPDTQQAKIAGYVMMQRYTSLAPSAAGYESRRACEPIEGDQPDQLFKLKLFASGRLLVAGPLRWPPAGGPKGTRRDAACVTLGRPYSNKGMMEEPIPACAGRPSVASYGSA